MIDPDHQEMGLVGSYLKNSLENPKRAQSVAPYTVVSIK